MVVAAILAAGSGERFGGDKMQAMLRATPIWWLSYARFLAHPEVDRVIVVASETFADAFRRLAPDAELVAGGATRQASAAAALAACPADAEFLLFQDAARPFTPADLISRVIAGVRRSGACAPAVPVTDTIREKESHQILDRSNLVAMQTPQGARVDLWREAFAKADREYTDDLALLEAIGIPTELVPGDPENFKITVAADLARADAMLGPMETRVGIGYDVHRFAEDPDRTLWLGGVLFEGERGLDGHSDADVVLHAAVDALLGAAALGDIGVHFPPSDQRWRNEPSQTFLRHAGALLAENGWAIVNLDVSVIAEHPKLMPRAMQIRAAMAAALEIDPDRVSLKATTNEGLGAIGRSEGIAAYATASIRKL